MAIRPASGSAAQMIENIAAGAEMGRRRRDAGGDVRLHWSPPHFERVTGTKNREVCLSFPVSANAEMADRGALVALQLKNFVLDAELLTLQI